MRFTALWLAFLILNLIGPTSETTVTMSISQNRKYMNSGSVSVDISSATTWNPYAVNVTYPFSFSS